MSQQNPNWEKRRVLVVEDTPAVRRALMKQLELLGLEPVEAKDAATGLETLSRDEFDLIISDVRMPGISGLEFAEHVRKRGNTPLLLISAYGDLADNGEADRVGATAFLSKPFLLEDLRHALSACFGEGGRDLPDREAQFVPVERERFHTGTRLLTDIYVRFSQDRFFRFGIKGNTLDPDKLRRLESIGVTQLFIPKNQFSDYVNFTVSLNERVQKSAAVDPGKRRLLNQHVSELLLEQLYLEGISHESYHQSLDTIEASLNEFMEGSEALTLLQQLKQHTDGLLAHSMATSIYSVLTARHLEYPDPEIKILSLAALFHDIGLAHLDAQLLKTPPDKRTPAQKAQYEDHPLKSATILKGVNRFPKQIVELCLQHHERNDESGFPASLSRDRLHPLSRILIAVNEFCTHVLPCPFRDTVEDPRTVIAELYRHPAHYDQKILQALEEQLFPAQGGGKTAA